MSIMLQSRLVQSRAEVCVARPSAMRPSRRAALTTVSAQRSVYERQSLAQTAFAAGAALLLSASPAFATASETFVLAEKSGKEIRATQESGKASPPPKSSGTQDAPRLQSPVRDIIGKVTGGADKPPGVGTAAAPNTEDALGGGR